MREPKKKVILLAETNFLRDIVFERHKDCAYLGALAMKRVIRLAIPQYAFAEATAKLKDIERAYVQTV